MTSLRARVFVTVTVVLVGATLLAGVLSRRATLVEERQVLGPPAFTRVEAASRVRDALDRGGWPAVSEALSRLRDTSSAQFIVIAPDNHVLAASSADLAAARVRTASADGALEIETNHDGALTAVQIRGVKPEMIEGPSGPARIYQLPQADRIRGTIRMSGLPPWILSILLTALVAVVVTLLVAGRILRPIDDLTRAARQMESGALDVRVDVRGDDELSRLSRAFNDMAGQLAHTERLKRQLVSDVAHELRSPVTNLRCTLEAMQDGLAAIGPAAIDSLHNETLLLQRLIADLQDLALADAGGLRLTFETVDIGEAARRAIGAEGPPPHVQLQLPDPPLMVRGDAARLEQIVRNLLSNARRHTPADGGIAIQISSAGRIVRVDVTDTGEGIAPAHLPLVFERFYRADSSRDRATGGAGLGLAIVKRLVEAHGGQVTAHSDGVGRGARFTLLLPAA